MPVAPGALLLTPLSYDQLKEQLKAFPAGVPRGFTQQPSVQYIHIQDGEANDPTHNALRYFFIWERCANPNFIWKQVNKRQPGVLKIKCSDLPAKLFNVLREKAAATWKSAVYRYTQACIKANKFEVVWAGADAYVVKRG